MGGGGDFLFGGEVGEVLGNFGNAHFFWVAFAVEEDVVFDPLEVGVFGAGGVVFDSKGVAVLVEEFWGLCGWIWLGHFSPLVVK